MGRIRRLFGLFLVLAVLITPIAIPAPSRADGEGDGRVPWTIYSYPQVRWGSNNRTVYTFDFLVPLRQTDKDILFFNPRFSLDNRDASEVNLGFGYRRLLLSDKVILGVYGYYDSRLTDWGTRHEQAGLGAEVMTDWVTGRFNGYLAVTGPWTGAAGAAGSIYTFRDVGIYYAGGAVEETLSGYDGELGFKVPYLSDYVETWVYAGGYHFEGKYVDPVNGFSSRIEVVPTDFIRLNFEYRNDTIRGDEYYGEVALAVPFSVENLCHGKNPFAGIGGRFGGDRTLKERLTEPVRRDIDVRVGRDGDNARVPGAGTLLADIVFVSENAENIAGVRDGTFEHPYATIDEAMTDPGSGVLRGVTTLHVMNDDSGAGAAGGGAVGLASMMIWGSAAPHPTFGFISNQFQGYPTINSLVTLNGDSDNVFGMSLIAETGIESNANTLIHDNVFMNNIIGIDVPAGSPAIYNNSFSGITGYGVAAGGGSPAISDNTFAGGLRDVLFYSGTGGSVSGNMLGGSVSGIISAAGFTGTVAVTGNTFNGDSIGLRSSNGTFTVTDNVFDCQTGIDASDGTLTVTGNAFAGDYGIQLDGGTLTATGNEFNTGTGIRNEGGTLTATDNLFTGDYGLYSTDGTSMLRLNSFNNVYGVYTTGGTVTVGESEATGNTFTCNYGIYNDGTVLTATGNTFNVVADYELENYCGIYNDGGTSTILNNTFGGEYYSYGIYNAGTVTATGNTFTNYTGLYHLFGTSTVSNNSFFNSGIVEMTGALTATGNSFTNSGILVYDGSAIIGTIATGTGNTFSGGGCAISAAGGYVSIIGNTIGTAEHPMEVSGIYLGAGVSLTDPIYRNHIIVSGTGPDAYGIYSEAPNFSINDNTIDVTNPNGNAYGIYAYNTDTLSSPIVATTISVTGLNAYGIHLDAFKIGDPAGSYQMILNYVTINATATGGAGSLAWGIDVSTAIVQDFTLDWGILNVTAASGDARGITISAFRVGDGTIQATMKHIDADIDGGASRYFLYLHGEPSGGNSIDWSGNSYTPYGGSWSGNYDVGGYATPGPVWTNIPDAEITP